VAGGRGVGARRKKKGPPVRGEGNGRNIKKAQTGPGEENALQEGSRGERKTGKKGKKGSGAYSAKNAPDEDQNRNTKGILSLKRADFTFPT